MNQKDPSTRNDDRALDETIAPEGSSDTNSDVDFATDAIPQSLGRYTIKQLLGRGGMGAVYLAHDAQLQRDVALKVPKFDAGTNSKLVSRFYREARSAANLSHPNLCPVFDVGEIEGTHYIAMAYIKGRPLASYVNPEKPSATRAIATIIRKVALAMEDAHQSGIIHRDLKPANIMIDHRKEPIVMDFGLACPQDLGNESRLTQDGALLGSPAYMSPEQLKGKSNAIGPASDIYSLGVVLYELLSGRLPFTGAGSTIAMIGQILTEEPTDLITVRADIDPALAAICKTAMTKDPESRYSTMKEFADALGGYLQSAAGDKRLREPTKTATVTVSQIQLTEQSKLAKTLCESGQFVAAVSILKQIIENPEAKGSKMLHWAQSMLPKVEAEIAKADQPESGSQPTAVASVGEDNLFADLPSVSAPTAFGNTTPYRRPSATKANNKSAPPLAVIGALAGIGVLIIIGALAYFALFAARRPASISGPASTAPVASAPIEPDPAQNPVSGRDLDFAGELLDLFDRNSDQRLDQTEIPPPMVSPMMSADANRDDRLSKQELASLDRNDFPRDLDTYPRPPGEPRPPRLEDLRELDGDGDGRIELSAIRGPRRLFLERADTNSDGVLDQDEIANLREREIQRRRGGGAGRGEPPDDGPFRSGTRPRN